MVENLQAPGSRFSIRGQVHRSREGRPLCGTILWQEPDVRDPNLHPITCQRCIRALVPDGTATKPRGIALWTGATRPIGFPIEGDIWFDTGSQIVHVFSENAWQ